MAKPPNKDPYRETAPTSFPETPPRFAQPSHDFTLQVVMEMQKSIGELSSKTDRLISDSKSQSEKLDKVRMQMHWVAGGAVMLVAIITLAANLYTKFSPLPTIVPPPSVTSVPKTGS